MHANQWVILAAVLVLAAAGYRYSLWRHPTRKCHGCGGTGRHRAAVFRHGEGPCVMTTIIGPRAQCDGGRVPRWGVRLLNVQPLKKEKRR
jgi:hypothetical protein